MSTETTKDIIAEPKQILQKALKEEHNKIVNVIRLYSAIEKKRDLTRRPFIITVILIAFVFVTLWLFYIHDGVEGAKMAWSLVGPIIGAITGFWLSKT